MAKTKLKKKRPYKHPEIPKEVKPVAIEEPLTAKEAEAILQTTEAHPQDRMMRYGRNPICPKCKSPSVICLMGRTRYKKYRCRIRECRHVWEVFE